MTGARLKSKKAFLVEIVTNDEMKARVKFNSIHVCSMGPNKHPNTKHQNPDSGSTRDFDIITAPGICI